METNQINQRSEKPKTENQISGVEDLFLLGLMPTSPASMYTRPGIIGFKVAATKYNDVIEIEPKKIKTITYENLENDEFISWEFATDDYDIGFGLYFRWAKPPKEPEEDEEGNKSDEEENKSEDENKSEGENKSEVNDEEEERISVIIPISRCNCHEVIHGGSHPIPGQGVYLLKFDNSFSSWRSKTLYYHISG